MATKLIRTRRAAGIRLPRIMAVVKQIVEAVAPEKIVLFGSHARGDATRDSDVDLLIITRLPPHSGTSLRIRRQITYDFPLDLVVVGSKRLARRIEQGDYFLREAMDSGKVLYESPDR